MTNTSFTTIANPWADFNKFDKFFIGHDGLAKRLTEAAQFVQKATNFPPYNIVKVDDNKYVIELAVAGFGKHNLELEFQEGVLTISGKSNVEDLEKESNDIAYLYKGIADRTFTRKFTLADTIEIKNAELINGMLKVWLENVIPDSKKPVKININDAVDESDPPYSNPQFLAEKK